MDNFIDVPEGPGELELLELYDRLSASQRTTLFRFGQALLLEPSGDAGTADPVPFGPPRKTLH